MFIFTYIAERFLLTVPTDKTSQDRGLCKLYIICLLNILYHQSLPLVKIGRSFRTLIFVLSSLSNKVVTHWNFIVCFVPGIVHPLCPAALFLSCGHRDVFFPCVPWRLHLPYLSCSLCYSRTLCAAALGHRIPSLPALSLLTVLYAPRSPSHCFPFWLVPAPVLTGQYILTLLIHGWPVLNIFNLSGLNTWGPGRLWPSQTQVATLEHSPSWEENFKTDLKLKSWFKHGEEWSNINFGSVWVEGWMTSYWEDLYDPYIQQRIPKSQW